MEVPIPERGRMSEQVAEALVAGVSLDELFNAGFIPGTVEYVYLKLKSQKAIPVIPRATGIISRARKRQIFRRDNYICQFCGETFPEELLQPNHIDHDKRHNRTSNLETACIGCNHIEGKIYSEMLREARPKGKIGELERLEISRKSRAKAKEQLDRR